jgi:hypothetical protein
MALKPWYKEVEPRDDLKEGKPLDASEFAVHLDHVRLGVAFFAFFGVAGLAPDAPVTVPSRRASRYFPILDLATFLCSLQTMPNTGAAGFVQPGTGHSCLFRVGASTEDGVKRAVVARCFGGRPGPRFCGVPKAPARAAWIR